jgi:hypothetical protein
MFTWLEMRWLKAAELRLRWFKRDSRQVSFHANHRNISSCGEFVILLNVFHYLSEKKTTQNKTIEYKQIYVFHVWWLNEVHWKFNSNEWNRCYLKQITNNIISLTFCWRVSFSSSSCLQSFMLDRELFFFPLNKWILWKSTITYCSMTCAGIYG